MEYSKKEFKVLTRIIEGDLRTLLKEVGRELQFCNSIPVNIQINHILEFMAKNNITIDKDLKLSVYTYLEGQK